MLVTIDHPKAKILYRKTIDFKPEEFPYAVRDAWRLLMQGIEPFFPAAGLAAPQVGSNRSIFIYSYDRKPENLTCAINPTYEPLSDETRSSWEGCLSVIHSGNCFQLASIPRYLKIRVRYLNLDGEVVELVLQDFGAKVFQHEYDHLQGILNINHPQAEVKAFASKEALQEFSAEVRQKDAAHYQKPS